MFVQSVIFAVLSFYAAHRPDFLLLFLFLLTFDLLWNIATQQEVSEARDVAHQRGWMLNNVVAVSIVIILSPSRRILQTKLSIKDALETFRPRSSGATTRA